MKIFKSKFNCLVLDDVNERQTVRETWLNIGSFDESEKIHRFVIGTKNISENERKRLKIESEEYKDLLFIDKLIDSFDNLSKKTAYAIESVVRDYEFKYLLKTDTDSFVRIGYLLKVLFSASFNIKFCYRLFKTLKIPDCIGVSWMDAPDHLDVVNIRKRATFCVIVICRISLAVAMLFPIHWLPLLPTMLIY